MIATGRMPKLPNPRSNDTLWTLWLLPIPT